MKFYDQVEITVHSGKGGDGVISGRREKGEPWGGPAGGDGGRGGSVILRASKDEHTLLPYRYKHVFKAQSGQAGQSKEKYGAAGEDIILPVPIGTLIKEKDSGKIIAHLGEDNQEVIIAKGGKGGAGNIHFKNPNNQYPQIALYGEPGEIKEIIMELQLLGDVALVGTPSVGKSTLINTVSNVKAKTADYEFTTLVPNIGIVDWKETSFVMVDVPGLIEGASSGKGLGNMFLRHILKARIWTIMLDAKKDLPGIEEWGLLMQEIIQYVNQRFVGDTELGIQIDAIEHTFALDDTGIIWYEAKIDKDTEQHILLRKAIVTVVNKYDLLDPELREEYKKALEVFISDRLATHECKTNTNSLALLTLSALTRDQIEQYLNLCIQLITTGSFVSFLDQEIFEVEKHDEVSIYDVSDEIERLLEEGYITTAHAKFSKVREVDHPMASYLTFVLPRGNEEAQLRYWKTMSKEGILKLCERAGARVGDILKIKSHYAGHDDKYILRE